MEVHLKHVRGRHGTERSKFFRRHRGRSCLEKPAAVELDLPDTVFAAHGVGWIEHAYQSCPLSERCVRAPQLLDGVRVPTAETNRRTRGGEKLAFCGVRVCIQTSGGDDPAATSIRGISYSGS